MKFSLDGLKNANWKQLALDHAEKAGLVVAAGVAGFLLFSGLSLGEYTKKDPVVVMGDLDQQRGELKRSVLTAERKAEDVPAFDVKVRAIEVVKPLERGRILWPNPMTAPIHPPQEPGGEPTWKAVQNVLVDYVALPVRLAPEDSLLDPSALGVDTADPEEADEPGEFDINPQGGTAFGGGLGGDFGGDFGRGSDGYGDEMGSGPPGMSGMPGGDPRSKFGGGYGDEMGSDEFFGEDGMMGGGTAPPESNARGKGVKMVAVRGVFPYREQIKELADALKVPFADAKGRLEFLGLEVQRQRAAPGPNPWTEDWEDVDRDAAIDLLAEDLNGSTGRTAEVVSPSVTDPVLTMPLLTRGFGTWQGKAEVTHPRIKEFSLEGEDPELLKKLNEALREEAKIIEEEQAAVGPQRRGFFRQPTLDRGDVLRSLAEREGKKEGEEEDPVQALIDRMTADDVLLLTRFFDVAVEPGQAYRYRVRVEVLNPNFGLGAADVSDASALEGETRFTPWSEPSRVVSIPPDELSYLASMYANPPDALPEARLEVTEYSREFGTLVQQDTRVDAGDLLVFEERNTWTLDPIKMEQNKKAAYPFVTEHVVIGVDALPQDAAELHPDLNLGNRKLPPGRVLLLLDTGAVREIDAGQELERRGITQAVQAQRDGLGPQLRDVNEKPPEPEYGDEFGGFGEEGGFFGKGGEF